MTETGHKTGKQEQDSDNESRTRTRIVNGEQEDSQRGDPERGFGRWHRGSARGLSVDLELRSLRSRGAGDLEQDFDRYATVREEEENKD